jgi:hypothetical protein
MKRKDVESSLETTIAALRNSLDFIRQQDVKERDDKVVMHRPRAVDASSGGTAAPSTPLIVEPTAIAR